MTTPAVRNAAEAKGRRIRWSDDDHTPCDRLVLEAEDESQPNGCGSWIELREERATARYATRSVAEVFERIVMSRSEAEWLMRELRKVLGSSRKEEVK